MKPLVDKTDRKIINRLQDGLPLVDRPYAAAAESLGICEDELIDRLGRLKAAGVLSRIGPMYNASGFGGGLTLCAIAVPDWRFEEVAAIVNGFPEVAHNYARDHHFNMWFVLATETGDQLRHVVANIECSTRIKVMNLPKLDEYYVGMRVEA